MASELLHPLHNMDRVSDEYDPYAIDNWSPSPPLTAQSLTPYVHAPFNLTPNRRPPNFIDKSFSIPRSLDHKLLGSKPLFEGFERPSFAHIAFLTVSCLVAYPALYILTLVARDKSLFTVRLIVAMWCSGVGFVLGYTLLRIGVKHIEAASEY